MNTDRFDAYEIDACIDLGDGSVEALHGEIQEGCFFTVYGHIPTGGVCALRDFDSLEAAAAWAETIRGNKPVHNWAA